MEFLHTLFTERVSPAVRERVLGAIADTSRPITSQSWYQGGAGCLFAVAGASVLDVAVADFVRGEVASGASLLEVEPSDDIQQRVAIALGITTVEVDTGIREWDTHDHKAHEAFREAIGAHLKKLQPECIIQITSVARDDQAADIQNLLAAHPVETNVPLSQFAQA